MTIRADPADIDAMLRAARASLARAAPNDPALTEKVCVLAWALLASYEHSDKIADLDQALRLTESHLRDETGRLEANVATMLANLLRVRNERTRSTTDLDRAVALCREAAASIPSGHPQQSYVLQSLAMCLVVRVQHLDRADDVTEAIELCREILPRVGHEGPIGCVWSINLVTMLSWRVRRGYDVDGVHEAVTLARQTLAATERLVGIRPVALVTLANTLALRFGVTGRRDDIAEAIGHLREAIARTPPKGAQKGTLHAKLAWLVGLSPNAEKNVGAGLDEAIEHGRLALAALAPGHPDRIVALTALGEVFEQRYLVGGDRADLDAAIGAWRSAAGSAYGPPDARMLAARSWRTAAVRVGDLPDAAEAAAIAVSLLPVLAWRGLDREVQERKLANTAGLASSAAALAIELGRAEQAVELIEQGRTVLWSQAVQTRDDLSSLRAAAPELADRLDQTRQALNGFAKLDRTGQNADRELRGYRKLVTRWDELVSQARALPGFATFLGATPFARLRAASAGGPVVIINASAPRCDALIVRAGGVHVVPLPWLSLADIHHRADGLLAALIEAEQSGPARTNLQQTLWSLLRWLWDTVAAPVLTELDTLDGPAGIGCGGARPDR